MMWPIKGDPRSIELEDSLNSLRSLRELRCHHGKLISRPDVPLGFRMACGSAQFKTMTSRPSA